MNHLIGQEDASTSDKPQTTETGSDRLHWRQIVSAATGKNKAGQILPLMWRYIKVVLVLWLVEPTLSEICGDFILPEQLSKWIHLSTILVIAFKIIAVRVQEEIWPLSLLINNMWFQIVPLSAQRQKYRCAFRTDLRYHLMGPQFLWMMKIQ